MTIPQIHDIKKTHFIVVFLFSFSAKNSARHAEDHIVPQSEKSWRRKRENSQFPNLLWRHIIKKKS
jgi:hypothetical protein